MDNYYIGVMSGTSMDSVDVVLCAISEKSIALKASLEYPFDPVLKSEILDVINNQTSIRHIGELDHRLGMLFSDAVAELIRVYQLEASSIEAVGLHGQTVWHQPDGDEPFSMQLGDPNIVAARTKLRVVCDFRRKDIALGGQGAPFAPAFHQFLFGSLGRRVAVVNIGGMANITFLENPLIGYDTGPGNVLLDGWMQQHCEVSYDRDGVWARSGSYDHRLLEKLLEDPYFHRDAPKSTGREYFNLEWLVNQLSGTQPGDIQATLLELTVRTIANEAVKFTPELLLVCGGGAKNSYLMQRLQEMLPNVEVAPTSQYGVDDIYLEAMAFSWLAYKRVNREPIGLKDVTGARANGVLGGIYE